MRDENLIDKYKKLSSNLAKTKKDLFEKIKNASLDIIEDHINLNSNICVILSCPGEEELLNNKVAFGQTGKNLLRILKNINLKYSLIDKNFMFNDNDDQYQISIINSYDHVYFREVNKAEPEEELILHEDNLKRLKDSINKIKKLEYIIICGNNAETAFESLNVQINAKKAFVSHLGNVGIRNKYNNSFSYGENRIGSLPVDKRDEKRFELIAEDIIKQWKEGEEK